MQTPYYLVLGHKDDSDKSRPTVLFSSEDRVAAENHFERAVKAGGGHGVLELATVSAGLRKFTAPKKAQKPADPASAPAPSSAPVPPPAN